jgi:hypothetical protein
MKESENGIFVQFEGGQIVGAHSAGACDKNCHIIRCTESASFLGYVGIHESWEDNTSKEEQWVKINTDRKRSSYIEEDCFEK